LKKAVDGGELPGVSVLVMHHGKVVFKDAYGLIDIENKRPFRTDSVCQIASSTKWVSGAVLMAAVEDGKLSLDDSIGKYFPAFAEMPIRGTTDKGNPTVRQCFSHTSGLPSFQDRSVTRDLSVPDSVIALSKSVKDLEWAPGSAFRYGNTGMQIVGGIIANTTHQEFQQYMREKILMPLGMDETTFNPTGDMLKRIGNIYRRKSQGEFEVTGRPPDGNIKGALVPGGLYSTLDDYARFLMMMLNDGRYAGRRVLSAKAALETQTDQTRQVPIKGSPYRNQKGYGLGAVILETDASGKPVLVGDGGAWGTLGWIDRSRDLACVFFAQLQFNQIYDLAYQDVPSIVRSAVDAHR
jgi:CubicO group peptidase (beta-lactamase class C family)